jgi:hypothetical protein
VVCYERNVPRRDENESFFGRIGFCLLCTNEAKQRRRGNKIFRVIEPAISNLIFVYATKDEIQEVKRKFPRLQYHTYFENGRNVPIVVPQRQMENFIKATSVKVKN